MAKSWEIKWGREEYSSRVEYQDPKGGDVARVNWVRVVCWMFVLLSWYFLPCGSNFVSCKNSCGLFLLLSHFFWDSIWVASLMSSFPLEERDAFVEPEIPLVLQEEVLALDQPFCPWGRTVCSIGGPEDGSTAYGLRQHLFNQPWLPTRLWSPSAYSFVLFLHYPEFGWERRVLFMGTSKIPQYKLGPQVQSRPNQRDLVLSRFGVHSMNLGSLWRVCM